MSVFGVHHDLAGRYLAMMEDDVACIDGPGPFSRHALRWMCTTLREQGDTWPLDKVGRWLGFIQAGLIMHGYTSVDTERDVSRPMFHAAYRDAGYPIPDTQSVPIIEE